MIGIFEPFSKFTASIKLPLASLMYVLIFLDLLESLPRSFRLLIDGYLEVLACLEPFPWLYNGLAYSLDPILSYFLTNEGELYFCGVITIGITFLPMLLLLSDRLSLDPSLGVSLWVRLVMLKLYEGICWISIFLSGPWVLISCRIDCGAVC